MKKLFLMGRSEAGKTSLTQILSGEELHYHKTQYTNTGTDIIDSPGEYSETKRCGLGLACCALNPGLINRAAILYPFLSDFKLVWDLGADEIAYEGIRYYARWFDADEHQQDRWFRQLGYIDSKNFATRCCLARDGRMSSARPRPSAPSTTICTAKKSGIFSPVTGTRRLQNLTICC